jgi:hypothetical protein
VRRRMTFVKVDVHDGLQNIPNADKLNLDARRLPVQPPGASKDTLATNSYR